jgi:hypothetical protein
LFELGRASYCVQFHDRDKRIGHIRDLQKYVTMACGMELPSVGGCYGPGVKFVNIVLSGQKCVVALLSIMMSTGIVRGSAAAAASERFIRQVKGACPSLAPPFAKQSSVACAASPDFRAWSAASQCRDSSSTILVRSFRSIMLPARFADCVID